MIYTDHLRLKKSVPGQRLPDVSGAVPVRFGVAPVTRFREHGDPRTPALSQEQINKQ